MSPKTPEAKSDAVEADRVGGRRVGTHAKKKKKKNKKGGKDDGKRKLVRGVMPKNCVMCRMHSDDVHWGHPRHAKGVEGSECGCSCLLHLGTARLEQADERKDATRLNNGVLVLGLVEANAVQGTRCSGLRL